MSSQGRPRKRLNLSQLRENQEWRESPTESLASTSIVSEPKSDSKRGGAVARGRTVCLRGEVPGFLPRVPPALRADTTEGNESNAGTDATTRPDGGIKTSIADGAGLQAALGLSILQMGSSKFLFDRQRFIYERGWFRPESVMLPASAIEVNGGSLVPFDKISEKTGGKDDWILVPSRMDEARDQSLPMKMRYGLHEATARRLNRVVTSHWIGKALMDRSLPKEGDGGECWYHTFESGEEDFAIDTLEEKAPSSVSTRSRRAIPLMDRLLFSAILNLMTGYNWVKGTRRDFYDKCERELDFTVLPKRNVEQFCRIYREQFEAFNSGFAGRGLTAGRKKHITAGKKRAQSIVEPQLLSAPSTASSAAASTSHICQAEELVEIKSETDEGPARPREAAEGTSHMAVKAESYHASPVAGEVEALRLGSRAEKSQPGGPCDTSSSVLSTGKRKRSLESPEDELSLATQATGGSIGEGKVEASDKSRGPRGTSWQTPPERTVAERAVDSLNAADLKCLGAAVDSWISLAVPTEQRERDGILLLNSSFFATVFEKGRDEALKLNSFRMASLHPGMSHSNNKLPNLILAPLWHESQMAVVVFDPAARVKGYALGNMALDMDNIQHVVRGISEKVGEAVNERGPLVMRCVFAHGGVLKARHRCLIVEALRIFADTGIVPGTLPALWDLAAGGDPQTVRNIACELLPHIAAVRRDHD